MAPTQRTTSQRKSTRNCSSSAKVLETQGNVAVRKSGKSRGPIKIKLTSKSREFKKTLYLTAHNQNSAKVAIGAVRMNQDSWEHLTKTQIKKEIIMLQAQVPKAKEKLAAIKVALGVEGDSTEYESSDGELLGARSLSERVARLHNPDPAIQRRIEEGIRAYGPMKALIAECARAFGMLDKLIENINEEAERKE